MDQIKDIIETLNVLLEDALVPRNVKIKIEAVMKILNEEQDISIKVNKALHELDDITDDTNMQSFTRTQIWNIVSMLEKL